MNEVLEVCHVNAFYREGKQRRQILNDVNFTLYEGEIVGLVGESGSGKTTLCKSILGMLKDYDGEVIHHSARPQMVFQDPFRSLNPAKTVGWILEEPLKVNAKKFPGDSESRKKRVMDTLAKVHLDPEIYDRKPRELSGGQRQRVSFALAIITGAKFILADEPLSALDVTVQARMIDLMKELQRELGLTYLFVSHDLDVVGMLCKRVLFLKDGRIREMRL